MENTDRRKVTESFLEGSQFTFIILTFAHKLKAVLFAEAYP